MYLLVWLEVEPDITRKLQIWIYFEKRINKQTVVCSLNINILVRTMKRTTQQPPECIKGKNSVVKMLLVIVFMSPQSAGIFRSPQFQYHQFYQMIWFTCRWEHYVQIVLLGKQQRVCLKFIFMDASRGGIGVELQTSIHVRIAGPGEMSHCERQKWNKRCSPQHTRSAPVHPRNLNVVHPRNQPRHIGGGDRYTWSFQKCVGLSEDWIFCRVRRSGHQNNLSFKT